jgi:hypothetical protein
LGALWIIKRKREAFYLVKGQTDAPIKPVHWLGIKAGESWKVFGWIFTACAGAAILLSVIMSVPISADALQTALLLLPSVLLMAGLNAFAEES